MSDITQKILDFENIVRNKIARFDSLSKRNEAIYLFLKIFAIVISALAIPSAVFIFKLTELDTIIGIASFLAGIFTGLDSFFKFRNQWRTYEALKNYLSSQLHKFHFKGNDYNNMGDEERLSKFVDLVEDVEYLSRRDILDLLSKVDNPNNLDQQATNSTS